MKKIITVLGTRPEIIKLSPLIPLLDKHFTQILVHTGQHYSYNMDELFFTEIKVRDPDYKLHIGSATPAAQTGKIMVELEKVCVLEKPDLILVHGDTNSTLAAALVAAKLHIPLAHTEAGYRSFNRKMPEEINRVVTDQLAQYLFAGTEECVANLRCEGIADENIFLVGNTAIDALRQNELHSTDKILAKLGLEKKKYTFVTFHRAENTDDITCLTNIASALNTISVSIPLVLSLHPRTKQALAKHKITFSPTIQAIEPVGYLDCVSLMKSALFIMTDSGGIQEEAVELNVPCLILRNETEATELVKAGKNVLATTNYDQIVKLAINLIQNPAEIQNIKEKPFKGKKGVTQKIAEILSKELNSLVSQN